jgi:ribosome maturation factor RimP
MSGRKPTFLLSLKVLSTLPRDEATAMALSLEQIRQAADRVAASHQLEVVEIEFLGGSKHRLLRIFIEKNREERAKQAEVARVAASASGEALDHPGGQGAALDQLAWVTHEDCERFSRDFGTLLDVEDLVPGSEYTLEVSSPGLDRKLTARADYERFRQSLVKVQTLEPLAGNRHWQGRLTEVNSEGIVLDLTAVRQRSGKKGKVASETQEIAFSNIEKANLIPEM